MSTTKAVEASITSFRHSRQALRVAYAVHTFDTGGLERCIAHLCNHLDRDRFEPMVICLNRSGAAADWLVRGDVPIVELHKRGGNDLRVVGRMMKALKNHRVDIVHSHNWGTLVETSVACQWTGCRHVHTEHGQGLHAGLGRVRGLARRLVNRWAFNRAGSVLICAESIRPLVHARTGYGESQLTFIPNGVDDPLEQRPTVDTSELRQQLSIPDQAIVVGSVGRLAEVKDFHRAIDAVARLADRASHLHLVLVGDGPEKERLLQHAVAQNLADRVHLVGRQLNVADWLRLFDVYINCSRSEAMSLGILEAMGAGLPVVATDVGDNRSLVEGDCDCGAIVAPSSADELASALLVLVRDAGRRHELGGHARARFTRDFSATVMAQRHEQAYETLFDRLSRQGHSEPKVLA